MSKVTFRYRQLQELLDVRSPLLMLDSLVVDAEANSASGIKQVTSNEQVFTGHFPGHPIMPGVLQVAAMAQSAKAIILVSQGREGDKIALCGVRKVKFRKPVQPGMSLQVETSLLQENEDGTLDFQVKNTVGGELASSGIVTLGRKPQSWFEPVAAGTAESPLAAGMTGEFSDVAAIIKYLPHRFPFLLVDGIFNMGQGTEVFGFKNVTGNDYLVQGTANGQYPGYLQIETAAQLGCAHILSRPEYQGKLGFFMSIDRAVFYRPVYAGERLDIHITSDFGGRYGSASCKIYSGSDLVTEGDLKFVIAEP